MARIPAVRAWLALVSTGVQFRSATSEVEGEVQVAHDGIESSRIYGNINKYAYYFTDLLIGSPIPQRNSVIVDTGSRLVGFPCSGCEHCGEHLDPAFDIGSSKSARWLPCGESCYDTCDDGQCLYEETYSEGSSIKGRWFTDEVQLGEAINNNPPVHARMGCHNSENKLFYTQRANGIMGLAPSQHGMTGGSPTVLQDLFKDKAHVKTSIFTMCLATWGGRLTVGGFDSSDHVPEQTIAWTPMLASHYYFVYPEGVVLLGPTGETSATISSTDHDFGATIVDSGTTYTYFPGPVYRAFVDNIDSYCAVSGCGATLEGDCWRVEQTVKPLDKLPTIRFQMKGGSKVDWYPETYLQERGEVGLFCYTFKENNMYQTVLGISWMLHKDVIFDIESGRLGTVPANCPEHHEESDYLKQDVEAVDGRRIHVDIDVAAAASTGMQRAKVAAFFGALMAAVFTVLGCAVGLFRGRPRCDKLPRDGLGSPMRSATEAAACDQSDSVRSIHRPWPYAKAPYEELQLGEVFQEGVPIIA